MYLFSALLAVLGGVAYHHFVKRIPATIHPIVSIVGIYIGVLLLSSTLLALFHPSKVIAFTFARSVGCKSP